MKHWQFTARLTGFAALVALTGLAHASLPMTVGNLVVVRVGDGAAPLSSSSAAVFLEEYATSGGSSVNTVAMPIAASGPNFPHTNSGTASSEAFLTTSSTGSSTYLLLAGYGTAPGSAGSVVSTTSAAVPRVVSRVDLNGNIDSSTAIGDAFSAGNPRSVCSDNGAQFWVTGSNSGVRYVAALGATTTTQITTAPTNMRVNAIFGNQLYATSASGSFQGLMTVGTPPPPTTSATATIVNGFPTATGPSSYDFYFADAQTVYVADDRTNGLGGIQKWTESGGLWTLQYTIVLTPTLGFRGLTGTNVGGTVTLYATTGTAASSANALMSVVDAGPSSLFTTLATAPTNTQFRGVRVIPANTTSGYSESFDYGSVDGLLDGQNGGTGFSTAWSPDNPGIVYAAAGLSFSNLIVSGGRASMTGTNGGSIFHRDLPIAVSGTVYGSFLSRGEFNGWYAGSELSFVNAAAPPGPDSEQYSFAIPQFNNGDLKVSAHGDANSPIGCVVSAPPAAASGAHLLEETYLTLYKIDAVTKTATAWVLNASQFGVIKAGGITEAELNAAGLGSASNQIWARATQTESSVCPIIGNRLNVGLSLSGAVATTASIDELRLALTGFDAVTPVQAVTSFCSGNAVGTTCLGCGNNGAAGRGCANSVFASGALLTNSGLASVANDTLVLTCSDMPGPGLFFQANGAGAPVNFGDGMLCASVGIIRMGVVFPTGSVGSYPGGLTPNPINIAGGPISPGDLKHYQCWYRDNSVFCTAATFNLSNGISLIWIN